MTTLPAVRVALQKMMSATATDEAAHQFDTYAPIRPLNVPPSWHEGQKIVADCSKGVQFVCRWTAGAPDPMRNNWAAWGNSSTIWMELDHITLAQAEPGDLVTFGYSGDHHVAMFCEKTSSGWTVWNFGRQGQPAIVPLAYEIADHQGLPVTYCRLMVDPPAPQPPATPEDKLRAMTGFYPWLSWYLGEGKWKKYGARDAAVRPAVPKKIPQAWWDHEKQFMVNRQKGNP